MRIKFVRLLMLFAPLFLLFVSVSCKPDPDSILGNNMHDGNQLSAAYDTVFRIEAFSVCDDSIILQNAANVLLGTSFSPIFGSATYNLVVQLLCLRTGDVSYSLSDGEIEYESVDSVFLNLPYSGDFPTHSNMDGRAFTFSIYKLNQKIIDGEGSDSAYSSSYQVDYESTPLSGPHTVYPKPYDRVYDSNTATYSIAPLHIPLNTDFGEKLLDIVNEMTEDELTELASMPEHFPGIYIKVEPCGSEDESLVFSVSNLFASGADITVYYSNYYTSEDYQKFILGPTRFTQVIRDRSLSVDTCYKAQMETEGDTLHGAEMLYLEGSGGSRIRFRIPEFHEVVSGKVVLNQALLILKNVYADEEPDISLPDQIECLKYINRGETESLPTESTAGGYYNSDKGEYRINITRYLQQLLYQGTVDADNYERFSDYVDIVPVDDERYERPVRAVFYGPGAEKDNMRMEVIYTKIKE